MFCQDQSESLSKTLVQHQPNDMVERRPVALAAGNTYAMLPIGCALPVCVSRTTEVMP